MPGCEDPDPAQAAMSAASGPVGQPISTPFTASAHGHAMSQIVIAGTPPQAQAAPLPTVPVTPEA